jgi:hypothetical protein
MHTGMTMLTTMTMLTGMMRTGMMRTGRAQRCSSQGSDPFNRG